MLFFNENKDDNVHFLAVIGLSLAGALILGNCANNFWYVCQIQLSDGSFHLPDELASIEITRQRIGLAVILITFIATVIPSFKRTSSAVEALIWFRWFWVGPAIFNPYLVSLWEDLQHSFDYNVNTGDYKLITVGCVSFAVAGFLLRYQAKRLKRENEAAVPAAQEATDANEVRPTHSSPATVQVFTPQFKDLVKEFSKGHAPRSIRILVRTLVVIGCLCFASVLLRFVILSILI